MTKMQKLILEIVEEAKKNKQNPIEAVKDYFDEKDSHFTRARIEMIIAQAREAQRNEEKNVISH